MQTKIQNLIDHPETICETLNTKQLDRLIRECFCVHGLTLRMQYSVSLGGRFNDPHFSAKNIDDVTCYTGIFSSVLKKCEISTFSQSIKWTEADGFKIWFELDIRYEHFNGGSNGMAIAEFVFANGEWSKRYFKNSDRIDQ